MPLLETRYLFHRQPLPLGERPHLDMLHVARRLWRIRAARRGRARRCRPRAARSATLERVLFGVQRTGDVPGFEIPGALLRVPAERRRARRSSRCSSTTASISCRSPRSPRARSACSTRRSERRRSAARVPRPRPDLRARRRVGRAEACYRRAVALAERSWHDDDEDGARRRRCARSRSAAGATGRYLEAAAHWEALTRLAACPICAACARPRGAGDPPRAPRRAIWNARGRSPSRRERLSPARGRTTRTAGSRVSGASWRRARRRSREPCCSGAEGEATGGRRTSGAAGGPDACRRVGVLRGGFGLLVLASLRALVAALRPSTVCAPNFFVNRSTRPSVSISFWRPVKNGWQFEQISRCSSSWSSGSSRSRRTRSARRPRGTSGESPASRRAPWGTAKGDYSRPRAWLQALWAPKPVVAAVP